MAETAYLDDPGNLAFVHCIQPTQARKTDNGKSTAGKVPADEAFTPSANSPPCLRGILPGEPEGEYHDEQRHGFDEPDYEDIVAEALAGFPERIARVGGTLPLV